MIYDVKHTQDRGDDLDRTYKVRGSIFMSENFVFFSKISYDVVAADLEAQVRSDWRAQYFSSSRLQNS